MNQATFARFQIIGRIQTAPKKYEYKTKDGEDEGMICTFIVGTEPTQNAETKKIACLNSFGITAFGKIAKSAFRNLGEGDFVFIEGKPTTKKAAGKEYGNTLFWTEYIAERIVLLNRQIKTAYSRGNTGV
jgi:single-stranded DNA-binding protein